MFSNYSFNKLNTELYKGDAMKDDIVFMENEIGK